MNLEDIKIKEKIGEGACGVCYLINKNYVLKKLNTPLPVIEIDKFKYFLNYKNDSIMFPIDFLYDDINLYGYITKKAYGESLFNKFSSSNLIKLSMHSIKLENDIKYISDGKIIIEDLHDENILYDKNKLSVIDTDLYLKAGDLYSKKEILERNINSYKNVIKNLTIFSSLKFNCSSFIINKALKYEKLNISASEMIYKLKCDLDKYYKTDIQSIDDIKKVSR